MPASDHDTIAAIATPPGRGGVGVIRISGTQVKHIASALLGALPSPRLATLKKFCAADGAVIDSGLALYFPAPHSFTGQDILELQGHGGPVVLDMLLKRLTELGARLAEPGEFSRRAFLNDKLDLVEAEAIADLIASDSEHAAKAALRSLQGEFSTRLHTLTRQIIEARMHVEAAIDFPEEELDLLQDQALRGRLQLAIDTAREITSEATQGNLLREGMRVVIAGKPNAGKSSLLNRLAGYDAAIVTEVPGTTRDVLRERIHIDGLPLHIIDTAGLRDTVDRVEAEGIRRAHSEMQQADHILYIVAADELDLHQLAQETTRLPAHIPLTLVINKTDLFTPTVPVEQDAIFISAYTGAGLDTLKQRLKDSMGYVSEASGAFLARRRHLDALARATTALAAAQDHLLARRAGELCAEELRVAQQAIGEITGEFTSDDLLGRIFATFCIGK